MNFDILNCSIAQHYQNVDNAIHYLIDLYRDDVDITNPHIFNAVLHRYNLDDDGFESEAEYIKREVERRVNK